MKAVTLALSAAALATPCFAEVSSRDALAAALVGDRPVIVASRNGAGEVDVESTIDIAAQGADEIVDIGSITKTVTAIATLHLVENHGLTIDTTLGELLPGVPQDKAEITLHQLLAHTSGIVESTGDDSEALSRSDFLKRVFSAPLESIPGTHHSYSNAGYSVLAAVIEIQSDLEYEDYLIE
ncbi:serine hydrolase domain-containing protein [uncultured Tateyamaria sp.]|uniref:serine hydrolase domain-containing protein n=1 Tax=uncultured Tateyamaria sp. TaxID=455651 RepID=UPI002604DFED|nr:serine hydrolase domain-containing protein [uncultured Tateyamaria sp.]